MIETNSKCTISREGDTLCNELAKDNFRPYYNRLCHETQNTIDRNNFSELLASPYKNDGAGIGSGIDRNKGYVEKGSNNTSETRSRAISKLNFYRNQMKSNGFFPVINLKKLTSCVEYKDFKMEGLFLLNKLLEKDDFLWKLDLKDACFLLSLHKDFQKYVRFQWEEKLHQFLFLCFGPSSAPRIFTKLMKVLIPIFKRLNILITLYLDNILLIALSQKEMIAARDTLIFLLQNLRFLINVKNPVLQLSQKFLGVIVDSKEMILSHP